MRYPAFVVAALCLCNPKPARGDVLLEDFEELSDWRGLTAETETVHGGSGAGRWSNHPDQTSITKEFEIPVDASAERHLQLWLYSGAANGAEIQVVLDSDNAQDAEGWDYYSTTIRVDWSGWRYVRILLEDFGVSRNPVGWHQLNSISFNADGWGHTPLADTELVLDDLSFGVGVIEEIEVRPRYEGDDFVYELSVLLAERTGQDRSLQMQLGGGENFPFNISVTDPAIALPANAATRAAASITVPASAISPATELDLHTASITVTEGGVTCDGTEVAAAVPLPHRERPRTLLDAADFDRIRDWVTAEPWASSARDSILSAADSWPAGFEQEYSLSAWALPEEGGQWNLWYVCPTHGVRLEYQGPGTHVCPVDSEIFSGWPYDQVVYSWMHGDLARAARDLALAYRLTDNTAYAESAAEILLAYADRYRSYAIHNVDGEVSSSGGRVLSQTLDEAGWLIPIAWAYDLVADSGALTPDEQDQIEQQLLRSAVATIARNPAGMSNWQSWHNAATAAVGFALEDPVIISQAILGSDGFEFQMESSVSADGFWYEGSWGYHFYALDALMKLAEMSSRAGRDLYQNPALRSMFEAPILFAMPDWTLPAFNDSGTANLISNDRYYEAALLRYDDERFTTVLGQRARRSDALFWGVRTLPAASAVDLTSHLFPDAGYTVLRAGQGENDTNYIALDYGPHGGWHGHYDKLGFVLFARGTVMGVDPGTQSYAAPTHESWDKVTVAHNTVVIDERTQAEATGNLHRFVALPALSMAAADAGEAYPAANLLRTMVLAPQYAVDRYRVRASDATAHQVDWVYHNTGSLSQNTVDQEPYSEFPSAAGYQHLSDAQAAVLDEPWSVTFAHAANAGTYGSVWADPAEIVASFEHSPDQAATGAWSGRLDYDFSTATGYVLFSTESPDPVDEVPTALGLSIFGDASGHALSLRVYDSSDERFVVSIGPIDWTGWREFEQTDLASWDHFLGNEDGVFDPPVSRVSLQLDYEAGGPETGSLYADDIRLSYAGAGELLVTDFEIPARALAVRMLGEEGTTVVTGQGLGPDLTVPVPFVMARRQVEHTTFVALFEPYGVSPDIAAFAAASTDANAADEALAVRIEAAQFADWLLAIADGESGVRRGFGDQSCDGVLCLVRTEPTGALIRLVLAEGAELEDGERELLASESPLPGLQVDYEAAGTRLAIFADVAIETELSVYAPEAAEVIVNEAALEFGRDGDYVVLNLEPTGDESPADQADPDAKEADGGCGCRLAARSDKDPLALLSWLAAAAVIARRRPRRRWRGSGQSASRRLTSVGDCSRVAEEPFTLRKRRNRWGEHLQGRVGLTQTVSTVGR